MTEIEKKFSQQLTRIESKLDKLLIVQAPIWISEAEAMKIMGRSKKWFAKQRSDVGPTTLFEGTDWRRINGRTPEYKATSIHKRKLITNISNN